jgi:hypothetical protein
LPLFFPEQIRKHPHLHQRAKDYSPHQSRCGNEGWMSFYGLANAEADSEKILSDPYIFDLWHDVKRFSDSVLNLPEVDVALVSSLEKMRLVDFVEQFTNSQIQVLSSDPIHTQVPQQYSHCPDNPLPRDQFISLLPITIQLSSLSNANNLLSNIPMKQLKKDFERDKVIINGNRLIGAASSFEDVLREIEDILDRNLLNCMMPLLPSCVKRNFALQTLILASRTNSSGIAFEALRNFIGLWSLIVLRLTTVHSQILVTACCCQ